MVLKRKRSDSEISRCSSILSSPPSTMMSMDIQSSNQQIQTPSLFSSRTRKRHRDNRPSEEDVHEHTLSLLFSGQRNQQPQIGLPFDQEPVASLAQNFPSQRSTLHAFWQIPNMRQTSPSSSASSSSYGTPTGLAHSFFSNSRSCGECHGPLECDDSDIMEVDGMMEIEPVVDYSCRRCAQPVCARCAVSNNGLERRCVGSSGTEVLGGWMCPGKLARYGKTGF